MPPLQLWTNRKDKNYDFADRMISGHIKASGTGIFVHKYIGVHTEDGATTTETTIQDMVLLENRDRKYDPNIYELRGVYNVNSSDMNLMQFGFFGMDDSQIIDFHLNDMLALMGRRIMIGDVLELPHLRDDSALDMVPPAINKYYVVQEAKHSPDGYGSTWFSHMWRVRVTPMTASQEFQDILDQETQDPYGFDQGPLKDIISSIGKDLEINEAVVEAARASVSRRNYETRHYYIVDPLGDDYPWIFAGDGNPPNGALPIGSGDRFPTTGVNEGDYFLRTDMSPHTLYRKTGSIWIFQEQDYRQAEWTTAHRILNSFIDNDRITTFNDGTTVPEKQVLHKAAKPDADF